MTHIAITRPCKSTRWHILGALKNVISVMHQRRSLARLDDRALEDIGVTREQAEIEARRHVWDAPGYWHI